MSDDIVKNDKGLHPSPDAIPRQSVRTNKGKAPQRLEDYILTTELRKKQEKSVRTKKRSKTWTEQVGQLLPGIHDDNTLTDIAPKLSWRDIYVLSSVSPDWRQAIESREVYNERVRTHSTEALAVIHRVRSGRGDINTGVDQDSHVLTLFSVRDKYELDLPPIPFCGGIPSASQHVSLDGKVYVLGGKMERRYARTSKEVYVLDLAGQWQWKRCARMHHARRCFGAATLDGKIYVFGGCSLADSASTSEVYNPKVDAWSPVIFSGNGQVNHRIEALGEKIALSSGGFYIPRGIDPLSRTRYRDCMFTAQGKFYVMTKSVIFVYNHLTKLWRPRHSFLNDPVCGFRNTSSASGLSFHTMVLGDELFFADVFSKTTFGKNYFVHECCLFITEGFGKTGDIAREKVRCSLFLDSRSSFACPIQL